MRNIIRKQERRDVGSIECFIDHCRMVDRKMKQVDNRQKTSFNILRVEFMSQLTELIIGIVF